MRIWAERVARERPEVLRIGYFGSYARGDWGVGSDLDLVVIVRRSDLPFERRAVD
ncbi:nucleotidyltransferase domain-containing protein [Thermoflexus sp.]|uniref:nucleotidyltransferase domain-containing protein n=1 Tax=Thermoflexus sp. TaxID=1969742 RepID=UPI0035E45D4F